MSDIAAAQERAEVIEADIQDRRIAGRCRSSDTDAQQPKYPKQVFWLPDH